MSARHGLVVGKFYPPHSGHHFLIDTAASVCDAVTVVVAASDVETIPLELRCAWVEAEHSFQPNVHVVGCLDNDPIDYADAHIWDLHMAVFEQAVRCSPARGPVDAVFTNEAYGVELARRFGAIHVDTGLVGVKDRLSASAVRSDPVGHWEDLGPGVKAWFTKRVVVVGAESTGTTTLARSLCETYRSRGGVFGPTRWVPEYGREITLRKLATLSAERTLTGDPLPTMSDIDWSDDDFENICVRQNRWEDEAALIGSPLLVCDTDSWATSLWQERYLGHVTPAVERLGGRRDRALYILTRHEGVPFVQDGIRDGEAIRAGMTTRFESELNKRGLPFLVLTDADPEGRLAEAMAAIDALFDAGWDLGVPLEYSTVNGFCRSEEVTRWDASN